MAVYAALLPARAAHAQVSLDSLRIAAKDTVALAKFYHAAFGMQEVNRIEYPGGTELLQLRRNGRSGQGQLRTR
jgi:hypothetical protein